MLSTFRELESRPRHQVHDGPRYEDLAATSSRSIVSESPVVAFMRNITGQEDITYFRGFVYRSPLLVITLAVFLLSLLGMPPLAGFTAKFQIFRVVFEAARDYAFAEFMKDWGPNSPGAAASYTIPKSRSCGSGVIVTVDLGHAQEDALWVQRGDLTIGFSPYPVCQTGS